MKKKQKYQDLEKTAKFTKRVHPNLHRLENTRTEIKSFLIITEGVNTEPSYFEKFKLPTAEIEIVGVGRNTYSLVVYAITLMERRNQERLNRRKSKFDEVWCVFDADPKLDAPKQLTHFKNAIDLAHEHGIYVAYSNQAFEYWFILHFEDHQGGAMPRTDYASKLNGYLKPFGEKYNEKSKMVDDNFFIILSSTIETTADGKPITRQLKAIQRAKRVLRHHEMNGIPPSKAESSTTVFQLVENITAMTN